MPKLMPSLLVATVIGCGLPALPAQAQLARTFVSSMGSDANDCNRLTPCRTFQHAHDNTLALGEITVLDPGGYGSVTITKGISIINDGVGEAGVLVSGMSTGIAVNAGASDAVSLRGLTVKGIGFGGGNGIVFNSGKFLSVENCALRNLTGTQPLGNGLVYHPNGASGLSVSHTLSTDNSGRGFVATPQASAFVNMVFAHVGSHDNGDAGLFVDGSLNGGPVSATVTDSTASGNAGVGFVVGAGSNPMKVGLMVVHSVTAGNGVGLAAFDLNGVLRVGISTVTGNMQSWSIVNGATLVSYGDNNINGNADSDPAPPTIARK